MHTKKHHIALKPWATIACALLVGSSTIKAATIGTISLPIIKMWSAVREREQKHIEQYMPLPTVLRHIIFAYQDTKPEWTETNNILDTSVFNKPCFSNLLYLSSEIIAAGTNNGNVELFHTLAKRRIARSETTFFQSLIGSDPVESLAHNKARRELIGGGRYGSIRIWDDSSYKLMHTSKESHENIKYLTLISPDVLASATREHISFWDMRKRVRTAEIFSSPSQITGLICLGVDSCITAHKDWSVTIWDTNQQKAIEKRPVDPSRNYTLPLWYITAFDAYTIACAQSSDVRMYDTRSRDIAGTIPTGISYLRALTAHHGTLITRGNSAIKLYDVRAPKHEIQHIRITEESDWSMGLAGDPDSGSFAASIFPSAIKTWSIVH